MLSLKMGWGPLVGWATLSSQGGIDDLGAKKRGAKGRKEDSNTIEEEKALILPTTVGTKVCPKHQNLLELL